MNKYNSKDLRNLYFKFFEEKNHTLIPSAGVIPENDPTVLFTTAGMHPLVPFLLGEKHPAGKRLVSVQKCIRTGDIDSVGDDSHLTFFEMLGNWSLGDYFKKEAIAWSYEFLTSDKYLGIDPNKLYFSCFEGDEDFAKDEEAYNEWINQGVSADHIFYLPRKNNFWILGSGVGPCGPDTEMFYDTGKLPCSPHCSPACDCGKYLEIWNDVFMQYRRDESGNVVMLDQKNVDTGMGLERTVCVLNGYINVYESDLFVNLREKLENITGYKYNDNLKSFRIIMDHIRSATFILGDDLKLAPSNIGAGYVLRRLIRRAIRHLKKLSDQNQILISLAEIIINDYSDIYPELIRNRDFILEELTREEEKFSKTLKDGERHFNKVINKSNNNLISGNDAFKLFDTFGFPLEMTIELANEQGYKVDEEGFLESFKHHQEISKTIESGSFKGGLADDSYQSTKYHTLTHLVLAGLKEIYGDQIVQRGANITSQRLRFDFNLNHKMTEEEKLKLENIVQEKIDEGIDVILEEKSYEEAKKEGATGTFEDKYGLIVKVYTIGNFSKEICGGPHVTNTNELGIFKIKKEESSSAGVRRIKAVLEEKC